MFFIVGGVMLNVCMLCVWLRLRFAMGVSCVQDVLLLLYKLHFPNGQDNMTMCSLMCVPCVLVV